MERDRRGAFQAQGWKGKEPEEVFSGFNALDRRRRKEGKHSQATLEPRTSPHPAHIRFGIFSHLRYKPA